jgi:hypothetical protein
MTARLPRQIEPTSQPRDDFREMTSILREIRDLLADKKQRARVLTHSEHLKLHVLLPAIYEVYGDSNFTVSELTTHAVIRSMITGTPAAIGLLFSSAVGEDFAGYEIQAIGKASGNRRLWTISVAN